VDLVVAVVDLAGRHDLVARMLGERGQRHVEVVRVLRLHVLAHELFARGPQVHGGHSFSSKPSAAAAPASSPAWAAAAEARARLARSGIASKRIRVTVCESLSISTGIVSP